MQENKQKFNAIIEENKILKGFDLKGYLLEGLSSVLNKETYIERNLYLKKHPVHSGKEFSPTRDLKLPHANSKTVPRRKSGIFI